MNQSLYIYQLPGIVTQLPDGSLFSEVKEYDIDAQSTVNGGLVPYVFRSYCFDGDIFITDMYPKAWANDAECFQIGRASCRERV